MGATVAFKEGSDPCLVPPPTQGNHVWVYAAQLLRAMATVVFLGPILYHSDKFLLRTWGRTTEALGIPTAFVAVAVPVAVAVIFFHMLARMWGDRASFSQERLGYGTKTATVIYKGKKAASKTGLKDHSA